MIYWLRALARGHQTKKRIAGVKLIIFIYDSALPALEVLSNFMTRDRVLRGGTSKTSI